MSADKEQVQASDQADEQDDDTEQPEVEGHSAQAVERLQRFIAADEAHGRAGRAESGQGTGQRATSQTDEGTRDPPGGA